MRKERILVTAGLLAFVLTGCSAAGNLAKMADRMQETTASQELEESAEYEDFPEEETVSEEEAVMADSAEAADQEDGADQGEAAKEQEPPEAEPWQTAYKELLINLMLGVYEENVPFYGYESDEAEYEQLIQEGMCRVDGYYLYDINKDGIPELVVKFGTCEADYIGHCYTFDGEKAVFVEEVGLGHAGLYTDPENNGVIYLWGHMGYQCMQRWSMEGNELLMEELFEEDINDDPDAWYTEVSEIVPGSAPLTEMRNEEELPIDTYEVWSGNLTRSVPVTTIPDVSREELFLQTIYHDGMVTGISADGYGGDTGTCSFEEYLGPNMVSTYADSGMQVLGYAFVDLNEDGQQECVLQLGDKDGGFAGDANKLSQWVILNEQDGTVYAYALNYREAYMLLENGTFTPAEDTRYYTDGFRVLFEGEQCFAYYVNKDGEHEPVNFVEY